MSPPAFLSFLSADFERLLDLERSLGARLGPILRSGPSFVSSSPLIRYCLDRRFNCRFFCFSLCFSSCFNTLTTVSLTFSITSSTLSTTSSTFSTEGGGGSSTFPTAGPSPTSPVSKHGSKAFVDDPPAAASDEKFLRPPEPRQTVRQ